MIPEGRGMTAKQRDCDHKGAKAQVGAESKIDVWVCDTCGLRFTTGLLPVNPWDPAAVAAERQRQEAVRVDRVAERAHRNGSQP